MQSDFLLLPCSKGFQTCLELIGQIIGDFFLQFLLENCLYHFCFFSALFLVPSSPAQLVYPALLGISAVPDNVNYEHSVGCWKPALVFLVCMV